MLEILLYLIDEDMNTIKKFPEIGDIMIKVGNDFRFLGQDATPEFVEKQQCVGVVYYVNGNHVKLVGGDNGTMEQWSCVSDYEIETIPEATGDYAVTLQGKSVGNFHYSRTAGTKEEFVQQLNAWLPSVDARYEAYMHKGAAVLQLNGYNNNANQNNIAGCKLRNRIAEEIAAYRRTAPFLRRGQSKWYSGINHQRLIEYTRNNTQIYCNPKRVINAWELYENFPVSENYFTGENGTLLRDRFATYEDYIKNCMAQEWACKGCVQDRCGKLFTDLLSKKTVLIKGLEKPAYPLINKAVNFDSGVEGFRKGVWWIPSIHELILLMSKITKDTKLPLDNINKSLAKKKGWSMISAAEYRWSSSVTNENSAGSYSLAGFTCPEGYNFNLGVSIVCSFNLNL